MNTMDVYKEEELLKTINGKFIVEAYRCKRIGSTVIGLCKNSSPMFCRQESDIPETECSWMQVLNDQSSILKHDGQEVEYNSICPKIAWGITAYILFYSDKDDQGDIYFEINDEAVTEQVLFDSYFSLNENKYKTDNKKRYKSCISRKKTNDFDKEFIEYHISQEESLINKQNTSIPDYIKDKAKEYIEWIKSNRNDKEIDNAHINTTKYPPELLDLFNGHEDEINKLIGKSNDEVAAAIKKLNGEKDKFGKPQIQNYKDNLKSKFARELKKAGIITLSENRFIRKL